MNDTESRLEFFDASIAECVRCKREAPVHVAVVVPTREPQYVCDQCLLRGLETWDQSGIKWGLKRKEAQT